MSDDTAKMMQLADEYVLGLLEPLEAEALEVEMQTNTELAKAVGQSQDRFLVLDLSVATENLRGGFVQEIKNLLKKEVKTDVEDQKIIPINKRLNKSSWISKQVFWPAVAATIIGIIIGSYLPVNKPNPVVVAVLVDAKGVAQAIVEDYGNSEAQIRFVSNVNVPSGKTMQVWTLPSKEMGPVSLGVLSGVKPAHLEGPALPKPKQQQLYEVTFEPLGGSPTGRPTGPILGKGLAVRQDS